MIENTIIEQRTHATGKRLFSDYFVELGVVPALLAAGRDFVAQHRDEAFRSVSVWPRLYSHRLGKIAARWPWSRAVSTASSEIHPSVREALSFGANFPKEEEMLDNRQNGKGKAVK